MPLSWGMVWPSLQCREIQNLYGAPTSAKEFPIKMYFTRVSIMLQNILCTSQIVFFYRECSAKCHQGSQFPSEITEIRIVCRNGQWQSEGGDTLQDCEPTCQPACQNGGACVGHNQCECGQNFKGKQCQYGL